MRATRGDLAGRRWRVATSRLLRAQQPGKAERQFEMAIAADAKVAEYHLWLGRAIGQQAATASVVRQPFLARRVKAEFERAVELDPSLLDARDGLIGFFLQAPGFLGGSAEKAREQQREIASRDARRGYLSAAIIAWFAKDTVETERALRAAVAAAPDSVATVIQLSQRQASWGRTSAAFATLDDYTRRHPDDIAARFQIGRLAATSGEQLPRAERILRELTLTPDWEPSPTRPSRAAVHYRLGMVLEKSGNIAEARAAYEAAVSLDPKLKVAQNALAALR